jgi:hypothetical protein
MLLEKFLDGGAFFVTHTIKAKAEDKYRVSVNVAQLKMCLFLD